MKKIDNASMKEYTTYKTGGIVKNMYFPSNKEELIELLKDFKNNNIKFFVIGNGSNLIVDDNYFDGAIINLKELNNYKIDGNKVYSECGVMMPVLGIKTINESLKGFDTLVSIPGTVGGCIYNNAGAYNGEIKDYLVSVDAIDEKYNLITFSNKECEFNYRDSIFKKTKKFIIISAIFELEKSNKNELMDLVLDRKRRRLASQPLDFPSAGSVFRNPANVPAGKLIDDLGLKGKNINGAQISEKHANFIVNAGNCESKDIKKLINLIKDRVYKEYNIELKLEQEIINWE